MFCLSQYALMYYQRNKRERETGQRGGRWGRCWNGGTHKRLREKEKSCNRAANDCNNEGSEHNYLRLNIFPLVCGAVKWNEKSWVMKTVMGPFIRCIRSHGIVTLDVCAPWMSESGPHHWWWRLIGTRQKPNQTGELMYNWKDIQTAKGSVNVAPLTYLWNTWLFV